MFSNTMYRVYRIPKKIIGGIKYYRLETAFYNVTRLAQESVGPDF